MGMDIAQALLALEPNAQFTVVGDTYSGINWLSPEIDIPTEAEITAKIAEWDAAAPMRALREKRNRLLLETDWWALSDVGVTTAHFDYRQALRDLPRTPEALADPATVVFPTKPAYGDE